MLGESCDSLAIDSLIKALNDTDWMVRREAARALGKLKDIRAADGLRLALADDNTSVRVEAMRSLGAIVRACSRMGRIERMVSQITDS